MKGFLWGLLASLIMFGVVTWYQDSSFTKPKILWMRFDTIDIPHEIIGEGVPYSASLSTRVIIENNGSIPATQVDIIVSDKPTRLHVPKPLTFALSEQGNGLFTISLFGVQPKSDFTIDIWGMSWTGVQAVRLDGLDSQEVRGDVIKQPYSKRSVDQFYFFLVHLVLIVSVGISGTLIYDSRSAGKSGPKDETDIDEDGSA